VRTSRSSRTPTSLSRDSTTKRQLSFTSNSRKQGMDWPNSISRFCWRSNPYSKQTELSLANLLLMGSMTTTTRQEGNHNARWGKDKIVQIERSHIDCHSLVKALGTVIITNSSPCQAGRDLAAKRGITRTCLTSTNKWRSSIISLQLKSTRRSMKRRTKSLIFSTTDRQGTKISINRLAFISWSKSRPKTPSCGAIHSSRLE